MEAELFIWLAEHSRISTLVSHNSVLTLHLSNSWTVGCILGISMDLGINWREELKLCMKPFAIVRPTTLMTFLSINKYKRNAWWQLLLSKRVGGPKDFCPWGQQQREEWWRRWWEGISEPTAQRYKKQGGIRGQQTGCPEQHWWRLSCRRNFHSWCHLCLKPGRTQALFPTQKWGTNAHQRQHPVGAWGERWRYQMGWEELGSDMTPVREKGPATRKRVW